MKVLTDFIGRSSFRWMDLTVIMHEHKMRDNRHLHVKDTFSLK